MKIDILTVLPELLVSPFAHSMVQRGRDRGLLDIRVHHLRQWAVNEYGQVDDYQYGGGGRTSTFPPPLPAPPPPLSKNPPPPLAHPLPHNPARPHQQKTQCLYPTHKPPPTPPSPHQPSH